MLPRGRALGLDTRARQGDGARTREARPLRMAGIHLDVSARKAVELSLKESEIKFRSLFELSPVGIALNDLHTGQFLQVNDAMVAPTGYTPRRTAADDLLGHHAGQLRRPTSRPRSNRMEQTDRYGPYEKQYQPQGRQHLLGAALRHSHDGRLRPRTSSGRSCRIFPQRKAMELAAGRGRARDKLTGLANRAIVHGAPAEGRAARALRQASAVRRVLPGFRPLQADQRHAGARGRR